VRFLSSRKPRAFCGRRKRLPSRAFSRSGSLRAVRLRGALPSDPAPRSAHCVKRCAS
jgi:hypothetical protein